MNRLINMQFPLNLPFDEQCNKVLNILAIHKEPKDVDDIKWRVHLSDAQIKFALTRIVEDKYGEESVWRGDRGTTKRVTITMKGVKFHAAGGYLGIPISSTMSTEEKLNEVLRAYVGIGIGNGAYAYDMAKTAHGEIPGEEVVMLARHLEKDDNLEWIPLTRTSRRNGVETKEKLTTKMYFTANIKGKMFLEAGGYKKDSPTPAISTVNNFHGPALLDQSQGRNGDNAMSSPITTVRENLSGGIHSSLELLDVTPTANPNTKPPNTKRKMLTGLRLWLDDNPMATRVIGYVFAIILVVLGAWLAFMWPVWFSN